MLAVRVIREAALTATQKVVVGRSALGQVAEYDVYVTVDAEDRYQYLGGGTKREAQRIFDLTVKDAKALAVMTDNEAVAYWNILQFAGKGLTVGDPGKEKRHGAIMDGILTAREIAHEAGKRTTVAA